MIEKGNKYKKSISPEDRVKLIRKGNEFFSQNKINEAIKIFVLTDYKDGLVRVGDYYYKKNDLMNAVRFYFMSENRSKIEAISKEMAQLIRFMININGEVEKLSDITYNKYIIDKKKSK